MLVKKTTRAMFRYTGDNNGFYKRGDSYYITVQEKQFLWWKYIRVNTLHGYDDQPYSFIPAITYPNKQAFDKDWADAQVSKRASKKRS